MIIYRKETILDTRKLRQPSDTMITLSLSILKPPERKIPKAQEVVKLKMTNGDWKLHDDVPLLALSVTREVLSVVLKSCMSAEFMLKWDYFGTY